MKIPGARIVCDGNDQDHWLESRTWGVTASEIATISDKLSTWERLRRNKLDARSFNSEHMERGHRREAVLADELFVFNSLRHNTALWATVENAHHLATPDGVGIDSDGSVIAGEIKSMLKPIPKRVQPVHMRQMQWQMHVLGATRVLYVREQCDAREQRLDLDEQWIERDDDLIDMLVRRANDFWAWQAGGIAALTDEPPLPDEVPAWAR